MTQDDTTYNQSLCLTNEEINDYLENRLDNLEQQVVELHLSVCVCCQETLSIVQSMHTIMEAPLPTPLLQSIASISSITNPSPVLQNNPLRVLLNKLQALLHSMRSHTLPMMVGAGAMALLLLFPVYSFIRNQINQQIAVDNTEKQTQNKIQDQLERTTQELRQAQNQLDHTKQELAQAQKQQKDKQQEIAKLKTLLRSPKEPSGSFIVASASPIFDQMSTSVTRGSVQAATGLSPNHIILDDLRPTFKWKHVPNAKSYIIDYQEVQGMDATRIETTTLSGTMHQWKPSQELKAGKHYRWTLEPVNAQGETLDAQGTQGGNPAVANFFTLDQTSRNLLKSTNNALIRGNIYANAGMYTKAEQEVKLYLKQQPSSQIGKDALKKIAQRRAEIEQMKGFTSANK